MTNQTNSHMSCPLSHLLRKCQLSQRESQEAGANCAPDESGGLDADLSACCSFRHGLRRATFLREEGFCLAQFNSSLPLGEMSRSDREGWYQLAWVLKVYPDTNLPVCCPLSHLLRKCQLSQRESREAGANCAPDESELLCQKLALSCAEC